LRYSLVSKAVLAGSLRLPDRLLHGCGGTAVVTVVVVAVVVLVVIGSFGCRISYRNSGIMGTEREQQMPFEVISGQNILITLFWVRRPFGVIGGN
jgi:hypothetical protein